MEEKLTDETKELLDRISHLVSEDEASLEQLPLEQMTAEEISYQVFQHLKKLKQKTTNNEGESSQFAILSHELRLLNISSIEVVHAFSPTFLGELEEKFRWVFEMQYDIKGEQPLAHSISETIERIKYNNELYYEQPGRLRYKKIIDQKYRVRDLVINLKSQIPHVSEQALFCICSLIIFDFERMSAVRQYDYIAFKDMQSTVDPDDRWVSCLTIEAEYKKPNLIIEHPAL